MEAGIQFRPLWYRLGRIPRYLSTAKQSDGSQDIRRQDAIVPSRPRRVLIKPRLPQRFESARVLVPKMEDHKKRVHKHKGGRPQLSKIEQNMNPEQRAHVASFYATERIRHAKQAAEEKRDANRKGTSKLKGKSLREVSGMVETMIQEAVWNGTFKNLKGEGEPLVHLDIDITSRLLKQNNCRPVWVDQMHELEENKKLILSELKGIHHLMRTEERAFGGVELDGSGKAIADLQMRTDVHNQKCADWNLIRPISHLWQSPVNLMEELGKLERAPRQMQDEYEKYAYLAVEAMRRRHRNESRRSKPQASNSKPSSREQSSNHHSQNAFPLLDKLLEKLSPAPVSPIDECDSASGHSQALLGEETKSNRGMYLWIALPVILPLTGCSLSVIGVLSF
ncbi:hypothetical protein AAMO2058_000798600 [Amorphochlora amoebiformis]